MGKLEAKAHEAKETRAKIQRRNEQAASAIQNLPRGKTRRSQGAGDDKVGGHGRPKWRSCATHYPFLSLLQISTVSWAHCRPAFARCPSCLPGRGRYRPALRPIGSSTRRPNAWVKQAVGPRLARGLAHWNRGTGRLGFRAARASPSCCPTAWTPSALIRRLWRWPACQCHCTPSTPAKHRLHPGRQRRLAAGRRVRHAVAGHRVGGAGAAGLRQVVVAQQESRASSDIAIRRCCC